MGKAKTKSGSQKFYNKHDDQMREFFAKAQREYASGAAKPQVGEDGSSRIVLCDGLWRYVDLWYGGEPYSGMTTLFYEEVACWSMVYWGRIMPYAEDKQLVLAALMDALQHNHNPDQPFRGPRKMITSTGLRYINAAIGGLRCFSGTERIVGHRRKDEVLYYASYTGGVVNKD